MGWIEHLNEETKGNSQVAGTRPLATAVNKRVHRSDGKFQCVLYQRQSGLEVAFTAAACICSLQ